MQKSIEPKIQDGRDFHENAQQTQKHFNDIEKMFD